MTRRRELQAGLKSQAHASIMMSGSGWVSGIITWLGINRFEIKEEDGYHRYDISEICHMSLSEAITGGTSGAVVI